MFAYFIAILPIILLWKFVRMHCLFHFYTNITEVFIKSVIFETLHSNIAYTSE